MAKLKSFNPETEFMPGVNGLDYPGLFRGTVLKSCLNAQYKWVLAPFTLKTGLNSYSGRMTYG